MERNADGPIIPMLSYEDGGAAMDWLARAFGFVERVRLIGDDGALAHGEMEFDGGVLMLATPTSDYEGPKRHREGCRQALAWSASPYVIDGVLVYVPDLDAHYKRAVGAGATILTELEGGYPGRRYRAEDPEGHRWFFIEREP
jgi:uncharacterized glyoxalase superfamily protein PhnB